MGNTTRVIILLVILLGVIVYLVIDLIRVKSKDKHDVEYIFLRRLKIVVALGLSVILGVLFYYVLISTP